MLLTSPSEAASRRADVVAGEQTLAAAESR